MNILGFDFSIVKPAACFMNDDKTTFKIWPRDLSAKNKDIFRSAGVVVYDRTDEANSFSLSSDKIRFEVQNSIYLADLILRSFNIKEETYLGFEGFSFNSGGNSGLQLSGYKYILMDRWKEKIPFSNMFTYAPQTIKKTAGCSKKGEGDKKDMIQAFIDSGVDNTLRNELEANPDKFKKRGGKNWIDHLDDIVDAYWVVETLKEKELS
jgi:hypothetical protein